MSLINYLQPNALRLIEVALAGKYRIALKVSLPFWSNDYTVTRSELEVLRKELNVISQQEYCYDLVVDVFDSQMILEIEKPSADRISGKARYETIEDIISRINRTPDIEVSDVINEGSRNLIKIWMNRCNIQIVDYELCIKIAKTIAKLGQSNTIRNEHIAEAMQYKNNSYDGSKLPLYNSFMDIKQSFNHFKSEILDDYKKELELKEIDVSGFEAFDFYEHYLDIVFGYKK